MANVRKAEKSRVHAKQRRTDEAKEISEIADLLPLPLHITKRLDKASILRLAITFLRLKHFVGQDKSTIERLCSDVGESNLMLESLGGFFVVISVQEEIIYVSENVEKHVGLNQVDMLGKSVYEFIFEKDKVELKKQFTDKYRHSNSQWQETGHPKRTDSSMPSLELKRQFFLRMKCSYQKRATPAKLQPSSLSSAQSDYVLLQWAGYVHYDLDGQLAFLAAVARPLQPTPIMELKMDGNMFISRNSLDLTFIYCDPRLATMLGYEPNEMPGSTMYKYHHPGDLEMCGQCHMNLMTAGTSISKYYRFLSKSNGWCWLQTRATIVYNTSKHAQYIVCMNYVISEREGRRYLMEYLSGEADTTQTQPNTDNVSPPTPASKLNPTLPPATHATVTSPLDPASSPRANVSSQSSVEVFPLARHAAVGPQLYSSNSSPPYGNVSVAASHADISQQCYSDTSPSPDYATVTSQSYVSTSKPAGYVDGSPQSYSNTSPPAGYASVSPQSHHPGDYPLTNVGVYLADNGGIAPQTYYANVSREITHQNQLLHEHHQLPQQHEQQQQHVHVLQQQQLMQQQQYQLQQVPHSDHSLEGSPACVPQYPSPAHSYENELSPTLYLTNQGKSAETPDLTGNLWLGAQPIGDLSLQQQSETSFPSLAEEMEEISMEHCHQLLDNASIQAMNMYSDMEFTSNADLQSVPNWDTREQVADRQTNSAYGKSVALSQSGHAMTMLPRGHVFDDINSVNSPHQTSHHSAQASPLNQIQQQRFLAKQQQRALYNTRGYLDKNLEEICTVEDFLRSETNLSTRPNFMDSAAAATAGPTLTSADGSLGYISQRSDIVQEDSRIPMSSGSNRSHDTTPLPGMEFRLPPSMAVFNSNLNSDDLFGRLLF